VKKSAIILFILLAVFACRMPESTGFYQPITLQVATPDGPPEYKAGWHDGCKSALSTKLFQNSWVYQGREGARGGAEFGNGIYQHDSMYQTGWGQAWFSCMLTTDEFVKKPAMQQAPLD
jgi:hypothetical protein